jgi:hypothetical protein
MVSLDHAWCRWHSLWALWCPCVMWDANICEPICFVVTWSLDLVPGGNHGCRDEALPVPTAGRHRGQRGALPPDRKSIRRKNTHESLAYMDSGVGRRRRRNQRRPPSSKGTDSQRGGSGFVRVLAYAFFGGGARCLLPRCKVRLSKSSTGRRANACTCTYALRRDRVCCCARALVWGGFFFSGSGHITAACSAL